MGTLQWKSVGQPRSPHRATPLWKSCRVNTAPTLARPRSTWFRLDDMPQALPVSPRGGVGQGCGGKIADQRQKRSPLSAGRGCCSTRRGVLRGYGPLGRLNSNVQPTTY